MSSFGVTLADPDELMESIGRLCDRYVRFPGDVEGSAVVEMLVNIAFEAAGCPPPSRIRVEGTINGNRVVGNIVRSEALMVKKMDEN
jgi:hypothetical protein